MELQSKPDFYQVLARFEAWWDCQVIDRALVTVRGQQSPLADPPVSRHATLQDRWLDMDYALDVFEAFLAHRPFLGEAFPVFHANIGPEAVGALFGCELSFSAASSWAAPATASCRDILQLKPDLENPYWQALRRGTKLSLERGAGKWITGLPDLHTNGDLLASLRDPEQLCLDLADDPESVRAACDHVTTFYGQIYEDCYAPVAAAGQPCTTWLPSLHRGRSYATNCDFICMISTEMFERTILPGIVEEMRYLDRNIFHLDGPAALKHLDALLALPELDAVEWVYGAGNGPATRWVDVYQKIQAAGKAMEILCQDFDDALAVARHIRPEGAWFHVFGPYTGEFHGYSAGEIQDFIRAIGRWSAGRQP